MSDALAIAQAAIESQLGQVATIELGGISEVNARRFALASSDDNPIYFSPEAASEAGYAGTPVPPLYLSSVREWGAGTPSVELQSDGTTTSDVGRPEGLGLRVLGGGQRLEFLADVLVDVPVTATFEVLDVTRRSGRSGDMIVVEVSREYRSADGVTLVRCTESRILR
jgi:acyl dehydratase